MVAAVEQVQGQTMHDMSSDCLYKLIVAFVTRDEKRFDIRAESILITATSTEDARAKAKSVLRDFEQKHPKTNICMRTLMGLSINGIPQVFFITL
ncbi:MAG: hypothetical protein KW806_00460 [Candidatus Yanofskybacteria bacterium]|nr:hypothetical protein [Candidatus Yanofskybacteria bacterium]